METFEKFDLKKHACRDFDTRETLALLNMRRNTVMSWGAHNWTNVKNKALLFKVNGHHFKGVVAITLGGSDLYAFHLLNIKQDVIYSDTDIYFDELVERIDKKIEWIADYVR